jgi:hypothetical protein
VLSAEKAAVTNLCQTRQIDQRQAEDVWREDLQADRLPADALVVSRYPRRLVLDLAFDLLEVEELAAGNVEELLLAGYACRCVWNVDLITVVFVAFAREVDELQNERSTCDDAAATGQEIFADNILEYGGFSGRL